MKILFCEGAIIHVVFHKGAYLFRFIDSKLVWDCQLIISGTHARDIKAMLAGSETTLDSTSTSFTEGGFEFGCLCNFTISGS